MAHQANILFPNSNPVTYQKSPIDPILYTDLVGLSRHLSSQSDIHTTEIADIYLENLELVAELY